MTAPGAQPSFPSLLAGEARAAITEYLSTTFALADAGARDALEAFLSDPGEGIFRGPYLQIRTPFQPVDPGWHSPLSWLPAGFRPFRHQAEAFGRLSTDGKAAQPTVVTTGTGSGKTEAFLIPLLDHARRARARGETGIKAVVLYPMNALVTDQARRLANLLYDEPALSQVTAGVYIGGEGRHATPTRDQLVDKRDVLRADPPDILLTNYKMLDLLLLRPSDAPLWSASPTSLAFVVLDEFHTYDGAQGTDVAMLLRRLGATCRVAEAGRPLGRVTPVATSATLGGGARPQELRNFAETIFGVQFGPDSLIGEQRLAAGDVVPDVDFTLAIPDVDAIVAADEPRSADPHSWQSLARAVLGPPAEDTRDGPIAAPDVTDPLALGALLRKHFLTRVVVESLASPVTPAEAVTRITQAGVLPWGVRNATNPAQVQQALVRFLALLSVARVPGAAGDAEPLVNLQVQLWVRELTRMLRRVDASPRFAWWHDAPDRETGHWLPAAHCRVCGRSGWIATMTELGDSFGHDPLTIWRTSARPSARNKTRALLLAGDDEDGVRFLDPNTLALSADAVEDSFAVHVTADAERASRQECPSCGAVDGIRFLGSSVATLLSVGLTQLFGSDLLPEREKKTLVFTDSVQDAAHRAAFIEGRAFQFNFRSALLGAAGSQPTTLTETAAAMTADLSTDDLYAVTPPDFVRRLGLTGEWLAHDPRGRLRALLASRIAFQAHLELGLNSRLGRTLELTGALAADIDADLPTLADLARDIHHNLPEHTPLPGFTTDSMAYQRWLYGLLEHLRTRGGIQHRWLDAYVKDDGKRWTIWGGSAVGMPKFPRGRPAPAFFTTGVPGSRSSLIGLNPRGESWLTDWTRRCLGVPTAEARALLAPVVDAVAGDGKPLERRISATSARVYGLRPDRIVLYAEPAACVRLQCPQCQHLQPVTAHRAQLWDGAPCPRLRCEGQLTRVGAEPVNFYRTLYRSRRIRRIVTHEHTGLLNREEREDVERRFTTASSPTDPNILTCTPTLELGIDIGDLATVALASLPRATANYLQRVGRAGRSSGNAFVFTAVPSSPRDLYYFAEPRNLIDGEVTPPGAYLNATELLQRQFFAFCLDRVAAGDLPIGASMPNQLGTALTNGMADDAWLRRTVDAAAARADRLAADFLALFGTALADSAGELIHGFAAAGLRAATTRIVDDWTRRTDEISLRLTTLATTINELLAKGPLDEEERDDLKRCRGESGALKLQLVSLRTQETLTGLSGVGLLPNYNLLDDSTSLDVHLWWTTDEAATGVRTTADRGGYTSQALDLTYERSSRAALTELAPGAFFYADGKRVEIDAVDIGPASQPMWRTWRLCPNCGWGTADLSTGLVACPRCGSNAVTDAGALHKVLPLQRVSAVHRLDDAVIDDDDDQRSRTYFTSVTGVDIASEDVVRAWRLSGKVFGAEYARRAVVRTVNLGPADAPGAEVDVAGETVTAARFVTCAHCGVVRQRHQDVEKVRHRGFCATRRGTQEHWEELVLSHELTTQAVRLLLPVSTLLVQTKLVSFMAALLLGLRRDFGGDPQHLAIVTSSMGDGAGQTRRFLVLHDLVPGGTGYLDRFGEPDRLRSILVQARDVLANCPCQAQARVACHRCLLGVLRSRDIPAANRRVALDLLEDVLHDWDVEPVDTVGTIDIATVELGELELRFRESIKAWIEGREDCSYDAVVGSTGEQLDLRLVSPTGEARRWRMRPLVNVTAGSTSTQPDFVLTRADAQDCDVAVYLDGRRFHASAAHNTTAADAAIRTALRDHGWRTWSATWSDVRAFEASVTGVPVPDLVVTEAQNAAAAAVGDLRVRAMWSNPVDFLLAYLADPDADVWAAGATQTLLALTPPGKHGAAAPVRTPPASFPSTLQAVAAGQAGAGAQAAAAGGTPTSDGPLMIVPRHGRSGLPLALVADPADYLASLGALAVLDDRPTEVGGPGHEDQWRDWLRWSNLLQFLTRPRFGYELPLRMAEVWTQRSLDRFAGRHLPLAGAPAAAALAEATIAATSRAGAAVDVVTPTWQVVLDFTDPAVHPLVTSLAKVGSPTPEPGGEVGDDELWQVELCWPRERIAVTVDHDTARDRWLEQHGWKIVGVEGEGDLTAARTALERFLEGATA